jgi:hypothetical protein
MPRTVGSDPLKSFLRSIKVAAAADELSRILTGVGAPPRRAVGIHKSASLLHMLAGPIGHVLTNLGGRAAHHSSNLAEVMAHRGFQHGAAEAEIAPLARRAISAIAGPEALATYDIARQLGGRLYSLPPMERQAAINALAMGSAINHPAVHHIKKSPILGNLIKAVQHDVLDTEPKLKAEGLAAKLYSRLVEGMSRPTVTPFDAPGRTVLQNAIGAAPAAAMLAADPVGSLTHFATNTAREVIGNSSLGWSAVDRSLKAGLEGAPISPAKQKAYDVLVSPAYLDPYREGLTLHHAGVGQHIRNWLGTTPVVDAPQKLRQEIAQFKEDPVQYVRPTIQNRIAEARTRPEGNIVVDVSVDDLMEGGSRLMQQAVKRLREHPPSPPPPIVRDLVMNTPWIGVRLSE